MSPETNSDIFRAWRPFELRQGKLLHFKFFSLNLWISPSDGEWQIAADHRGEGPVVCIDEDAPMPHSANWRRFIVGEAGTSLSLQPLMPDRPVIVRPEEPIMMLSGRKTTFFVGIPFFVRILAGKNTLCEVPSEILSNSWFGTPTNGELCYALHTKGRRSPQQLSGLLNRVVCPVEVCNESGQELHFQRICLRAPYLAVYQGNERLWSGMLRVTRQREPRGGDIDYVSGPPPFDGASVKLASEREAPEKNLFLKTFDNFNFNLPRL